MIINTDDLVGSLNGFKRNLEVIAISEDKIT
jgi:hypothetical protein